LPISKYALEKYLADVPLVPPPPVKGMEPARLRGLIQRATGVELATRTEARPYQLEALAYALWQRRCLLFMSMRLGKTKVALDWAEQLQRSGQWQGRPGLVVAHAPIGLEVWKEEAGKHSNLKLAYAQNSWEALLDALETDADLIVTSWSGLQHMFTVKGLSKKTKRYKLFVDRERVLATAPLLGLAIMDETHLAKNHRSLRFQIAALLTQHCDFAIGLTGTPVARDPLGLWSQAFLVDRGRALGHNYYFFESAFSVVRKGFFSGREENRFDRKKLPLLKQKLAATALTYEKGEVKSDVVYQNVVSLAMTAAQRRAYTDCLVELEAARESNQIGNSFVRLRQIASGFTSYVRDDGETAIVDFDSAKLNWLTALLEDLQSDVPTVIFHDFIHSGDRICAMLDRIKIPHARIWGGTKDRMGEVNKFRQGKVPVLVANSRTGGTSIDLLKCDYMCFYESPVSPIERAQATARPLSIARGNRPLVIDDLVCSPIERRILDFIKQGKDLHSALMRRPDLLYNNTLV
jgi:superfamily II DNA or RNA helicase